MRTIRASELGSYLYCRRAWWYQKTGRKPENQAELTSGQRLHEQHGRSVMILGGLRLLAYALLVLAAILIAATVALRFF